MQMGVGASSVSKFFDGYDGGSFFSFFSAGWALYQVMSAMSRAKIASVFSKLIGVRSTDFSVSRNVMTRGGGIYHQTKVDFGAFLVSYVGPVSDVQSTSSGAGCSGPFGRVRPYSYGSDGHPKITVGAYAPHFGTSAYTF